jgi:hypothetical protein
MANHPSSYTAITRDGLILALLDRLIEADGRAPGGNNPADREYLLNRVQEIVQVLQHPTAPRPSLP